MTHYVAMAIVYVLACTAARASPHGGAEIEGLVRTLLNNMTIAEKARQLVIQDVTACCYGSDGNFNASSTAEYLGTLGSGVFDSAGRNVDPSLTNDVQRATIAASRHGIAAIIAEECEHGVNGDWHTIFPSPYTSAATFDTELMTKVGEVMGTEARANGQNQCWAPVCGLAREPRWGRAEARRDLCRGLFQNESTVLQAAQPWTGFSFPRITFPFHDRKKWARIRSSRASSRPRSSQAWADARAAST